MFGNRDTDARPLYINVTRLVFVILTLAANYFLQFGMLYFIKSYVVDAGIAEAKKAQEAASKPGGEETLIHMLLTDHPAFLAVVLILWTLTILIEARKVERFSRQINALPRCVGLHMMFNKDKNDDGDDTWEIKGLTLGVWLLITIFIVLPKILIVLSLFYLGFQWLANTASPADLILNALALEFVVNIDEQLFEGLMPKCLKDQLGVVTLVTFKKQFENDKAELDHQVSAEWAAYQRSIFYFIMPIVISFATIYYMQCALYAGEAHETVIEYMR